MDNGFAEGYAVGQGNHQCYGNGMFGGYGAEWIWIIVLFALWQNGFGGFGNRGGYGGVGENYVLATDFATIERKLDGVNNGICSLGYDLQGNINTGFANVQNTLTQGFAGLNTGMLTQGYETRNAVNGVSSQLASCCCEIQKELLENRYIGAQQTCDIKSVIAMNSRDIIDSQRASTDAILGFLTNEKIASLQAKNAELASEISQYKQSEYLISQIRPCPIPSYNTCNPWASTNNNCCGCVNG